MSSQSSTSPGQDRRSSKTKRTREACKRCRIKKAKCDGSSPCQRCEKNNEVCVFGKLKRPCNRRYPKGYVELLEIQQEQLVQGIQKLYQQLQERTAWDGAPLKEASNGLPLTHDILEGLGIIGPDVLVTKHDFYGDLETLQQGLVNGDEGDLTADDASSDILFPSRKSARSPDLCDVSERYPPRTCTDPDTRMPLNVSAPNEWEFSNLPFEHLPPRSSGHILDLYDPIDSISSPGYPMVENINPPTAFFAALSGSWCPWDAQALTPVGQMG